jgi:hypothetical protein
MHLPALHLVLFDAAQQDPHVVARLHSSSSLRNISTPVTTDFFVS